MCGNKRSGTDHGEGWSWPELKDCIIGRATVFPGKEERLVTAILATLTALHGRYIEYLPLCGAQI